MSLKYTKMKIFHFPEKLASLPQDSGVIEPPVYIRIKPTNVCNHNCRYCAYRIDSLQVGRDMRRNSFIPEAKMMEIVDDIIAMQVKAVTFTGGGDPFHYPYLAGAVKKLADSPVKFAALTNGSRLEGELADLFAEHAEWLRVSMDGWDDASYSDYRGVAKGEFSRVMTNMRNFRKLGGKCYLGVSLIVDRNNSSHVYDFIRAVRDIGVDSIKISPCILHNDSSANNSYHEPFYEMVREQVLKAKQEMECEGFEIFDAYHKLEDRFQKNYHWCPYIQILPVIGADLNVYCCQDKAYNIDEGSLGSIAEMRFRDLWHSDKNRFFNIDPSKACRHHCLANEKNGLILEYLNADRDHLEFV